MQAPKQKKASYSLLSGILFAAASVIEFAVWSTAKRPFTLVAGILFGVTAVIWIAVALKARRLSQS